MIINISKVRGKMAERDLSTKQLANELGVSQNTLRNYMKNPMSMPYRVVAALAEKLCENKDEAEAIFFADDLR